MIVGQINMMPQKIMKDIINTSVTNTHIVVNASFQYFLRSAKLNFIASSNCSGFNELSFNNSLAFIVRVARDIT